MSAGDSAAAGTLSSQPCADQKAHRDIDRKGIHGEDTRRSENVHLHCMTEERDSSVYSVRTIVVHMDWRFIPGTQVKFIYKTADDTFKSRNCILALEKTRNTRPKNVSFFFLKAQSSTFLWALNVLVSMLAFKCLLTRNHLGEIWMNTPHNILSEHCVQSDRILKN